jgi:hypothetical protein
VFLKTKDKSTDFELRQQLDLLNTSKKKFFCDIHPESFLWLFSSVSASGLQQLAILQ